MEDSECLGNAFECIFDLLETDPEWTCTADMGS